MNTKRRTRSTDTGNHPRRRTRSISRRTRGGGCFYHEKKEYECKDIMDKEAEETD